MAQKNRRKKFETKLFSEFSKIFNFHDFSAKNRSEIRNFRVFLRFLKNRPAARFKQHHQRKEEHQRDHLKQKSAFGLEKNPVPDMSIRVLFVKTIS